MKPSLTEWQRLVAAARRAPPDTNVSAPYGFSTRVVAQSLDAERSGSGSAFARFSWPALAVAALVMAVTVAANFQPVMTRLADDAAALSEPLLDPGDSAV